MITGSNLGRRSTFTLKNLHLLADSADKPVRVAALIVMRKVEVISKAALFEEQSVFITHRCGAQPKLELRLTSGSALTDGDNSGRN